MSEPSASATGSASTPTDSGVPKRAGLVLASLIFGAFVCNLNLSVANIALPDIGRAFDASQTAINLVAVGCTLGLAMSVLYFGAVGDRYGRKLLLLLGLGLTVPASMISAWAPNAEVLVVGRIFTGLAAGMAYPTTLALITAVWGPGKARVKAIALWSSVSGGSAVLGPVIAGAMLESFWWGSVFLIGVPIAVIGFVLVFVFVPAHVNESDGRIDHVSGILSVVMIASMVLGLGMISAPGRLTSSLVLIAVSLVLIALFLRRQRRVANPLYDLAYAKRRLFWVPAVGGMIVFGSLMGSLFIGQQFLQNVLQYSTLAAGLSILPAAVGMMLVARLAAQLMDTRGARLTMMIGFVLILPAFLVMLIAWREETSYLWVGLAYLLIGLGAGLAMAPASKSLTSSVPVFRVGMASGTTDLQRDLGGSIMQAILGSLLTAGYATAFAAQVAASSEADQVSAQTEATLQQSYASAEAVAQAHPSYADTIIQAARESFLSGANWAYIAGAIAVTCGLVLIWRALPGRDGELDLLKQYATQDGGSPERVAT